MQNDLTTDLTAEWWENAPDLEAPAMTEEGAAAFAMAIFGKDIVPAVTAHSGHEAQAAFQIAKIFLAAAPEHRKAMQALALVIWRGEDAGAFSHQERDTDF